MEKGIFHTFTMSELCHSPIKAIEFEECVHVAVSLEYVLELKQVLENWVFIQFVILSLF